MGFTPDHHLIGKHGAFRRDERCRAVLRLEGDRQTARLEQAEDIARGRVGKPPLVGDDVVLGAVAGGDVVLGYENDQIGTAGDLMNLLRLALGDEGTERVLRAGAFCRSGVHGLFLFQGGGKQSRQSTT